MQEFSALMQAVTDDEQQQKGSLAEVDDHCHSHIASNRVETILNASLDPSSLHVP